jgi:hypothetical protein
MTLYFVIVFIVLLAVMLGVASLPKRLIFPATLVMISSSVLALTLSNVVILKSYEVIGIAATPVIAFIMMLSTGTRKSRREKEAVLEIRYSHQEISSPRSHSKVV